MDSSISLNKFISDTGYCSRREADDLIKTGRVLLNGRTAQLGNRFKPGDEVEVDGSLITRKNKEKSIYILLNKPVGITTTSEDHVAGNIVRFVNHPKRIFPIGRLDKDSEGLIILTNDGDIVNRILRAGNDHEKEYQVRVHKPLAPGFKEKMEAGIPMLGTITLPCKVRVTGKQTFTITLTQGLNRQIRRMCEYLEYEVTALRRVRIMHLGIDGLAVGKWRYLSDVEKNKLLETIESSSGAAVKNKKIAKAAAPSKPRTEVKKTAPAPAAKPAKDAPKAEAPKSKTTSYKSFRRKGRLR